MSEFPKFPHTAIITGASGCGKTYYIMNLLLNEYLNFFQIVIVICPTFLDNDTYIEYRYLFDRKKENDNETHFYFWCDEETPLEKCIVEFSKMFKGFSILFIVDDMASASSSSIVKKRTSLSTLAISGRHTKRTLWVLTQKYNSIGKDVREQSKWVCSFFCKDKRSFKDMIDENFTGEIDINKVYKFLTTNHRSKLFLKCYFPVCHHLETQSGGETVS